MLLEIVVSVALRVSGHAEYRAPSVYIADFGFYERGIFSVSWNSPPTNSRFRANFILFTAAEYDIWSQAHGVASSSTWHNCDGTTRRQANWTVDFPQGADNGNYLIRKKGIYVAIVQHCQKSNSKETYWVDAAFVNPDGQELDFRVIPSLTVIPIMVALFSLLFISWIVWVIVRKSHFLRIHLCLILILGLYIIYLVFHEITIQKAQKSEQRSLWILLRVLEAIYDVALLSILVIGSSGWCMLNIELTRAGVFSAIGGVTVFVVTIFVQNYVEIGAWQILCFAIQILALIWIFRIVRQGTVEAEQQAKAHLYLITQSGIDPVTTPIYEKWKMVNAQIWVLGMAFLLFLILGDMWPFLDAEEWIFALCNNIIQLVIVVVVMYLYRPRGQQVDEYMQDDRGTEDEDDNRDEILLDDLDGFNVRTQRGGMTHWQYGMQLPRQPLVVPSRDPDRPVGHRTGALGGSYTAGPDPN
jgi:hypothetical protein